MKYILLVLVVLLLACSSANIGQQRSSGYVLGTTSTYPPATVQVFCDGRLSVYIVTRDVAGVGQGALGVFALSSAGGVCNP